MVPITTQEWTSTTNNSSKRLPPIHIMENLISHKWCKTHSTWMLPTQLSLHQPCQIHKPWTPWLQYSQCSRRSRPNLSSLHSFQGSNNLLSQLWSWQQPLSFHLHSNLKLQPQRKRPQLPYSRKPFLRCLPCYPPRHSCHQLKKDNQERNRKMSRLHKPIWTQTRNPSPQAPSTTMKFWDSSTPRRATSAEHRHIYE